MPRWKFILVSYLFVPYSIPVFGYTNKLVYFFKVDFIEIVNPVFCLKFTVSRILFRNADVVFPKSDSDSELELRFLHR